MNAEREYTLPEMHFGASTAVETCMAVKGGERVLILGDQRSNLVNQAIKDAAVAAGAVVELHTLEEFAERPIVSLPEELEGLVREFRPHVSFYTAGGQPGELQFRQQYRPLVMEANPEGARHAHMINVTPELMTQGMRVDYGKVYDVTMWVYDLAVDATRIRVTNPKGSDLTTTFSPQRKWIPCHGLYHQPGMWGNLPEGEIFTSPIDCNGVLVADVLGDYFSDKYGVLDTPVTFHIEGNYVTAVHCDNNQIEADVEGYLYGVDFADRVGEFAIGTNVALAGVVGNLLQDEKLPGVHIAFGDPYGSITGADWKSSHHMDVITTYCTIDIDGRRIMQDGKFTDETIQEIQDSAQAQRPPSVLDPDGSQEHGE